jgi:uncharacterized protein with FMN-binding domain
MSSAFTRITAATLGSVAAIGGLIGAKAWTADGLPADEPTPTAPTAPVTPSADPTTAPGATPAPSATSPTDRGQAPTGRGHQRDKGNRQPGGGSGSAPDPSTAPSTGSSTGPSTGSSTAPAANPSAPVTPANPTAPAAGAGEDGTYTGVAAPTRYGPVQVEIDVTSGHIDDIRVIQYPATDRKDTEINDRAIPVLIAAALAAQSADVDTVSGATYTSDGYRESLQSAIDQAGL